MLRNLSKADLAQISTVFSRPFDRKTYDRYNVDSAFRRKNPADPSGNTWTERKCYFDSYSVAVGTLVAGQVATLFQRQVGGSITLASTNMRDTGKIANGNLFTIRSFGVSISANSLEADAVNALSLMTVKLKVQDITYAEGPCMLFPGGRGALVTAGALPAVVGTQVAIQGIANGQVNVDNMHRFIKGIDLLQGQSVSVELVSEGSGFTTASAANGGSGFTLYVFLDGYERRRTQ
jgi:hypothetical protein